MQISTNQFYATTSTLLSQLVGKADSLQTQIATGKKLQSASDDVVAYQRLASLKQGGANDAVYGSNITLAQSLVQQSDSTLETIGSQIQHAQELATQANSDVLSDTNRAVIATQLKGVLADLVSLANSKDLRGQPLFGAATGDSAVTQDADGAVSFTATGEPSAIPIGDGASIQPTDTAARVFGGIPSSDGGTTDTFAILSKLAAALDAGGGVGDAASEALTGLKAASDQISSVRGSVGARGARLDIEANRLAEIATNREVTRSSLEDTDVSTAITELQKTITILQATQASFTKLSSLSLFDYLR